MEGVHIAAIDCQVLRMADALPSAGLVKLHETEHLGVADQGKSQPQQVSGRDEQSGEKLSQLLRGLASRYCPGFP
jgi:hypothetical protein